MNDNFKQIIDTTISERAVELARQITQMNALRISLPRQRPLTRRQKVARWFRIRWDRVVTAWRVLRGDDIHEHCN